MRQDLTQILYIQDRSGSMSSLREASIAGFNEFIVGQKEDGEGDAQLRLVQFDHEYIVRFDLPIADVVPLTTLTYEPRGSTALLDALGRAISDLGRDLKAMAEKDRPGNVIVCIMTDGLENASREYTRDQVFKMITEQKDVYKWQFLFLGAGQDAIQTGVGLGIGAQASATYSNTAGSTQSAYKVMGQNVNSARSAGLRGQSTTMSWTAEQRSKLVEDDEEEAKQKANQQSKANE